MNFKSLALATTMVLTGLASGAGAQAGVMMCSDAVHNGYSGTCYDRDGKAHSDVQAWRADGGVDRDPYTGPGSVFVQAEAIVDEHQQIALDAYDRGDYTTMCQSIGTRYYINGVWAVGVLSDEDHDQTLAGVKQCQEHGFSVKPAPFNIVRHNPMSDAEWDVWRGAN